MSTRESLFSIMHELINMKKTDLAREMYSCICDRYGVERVDGALLQSVLCRMGNIRDVDERFRISNKPIVIDEKLTTQLMYTVGSVMDNANDWKISKYLMDKGCDINEADPNGIGISKYFKFCPTYDRERLKDFMFGAGLNPFGVSYRFGTRKIINTPTPYITGICEYRHYAKICIGLRRLSRLLHVCLYEDDEGITRFVSPMDSQHGLLFEIIIQNINYKTPLEEYASMTDFFKQLYIDFKQRVH